MGAPQPEIDDYLREDVKLVDDEIHAVLDAGVHDPWMFGAISYHMGWADANFKPLPPGRQRSGGKKLRAAVALLSYQSARAGTDGVGGVDAALPLAAAVELIHNFILIHDDIEHVARSRRGRSALWTICGQAQAINVGDALHALAYACLGRSQERGQEVHQLVVLAGALSRAVVDMTIWPRPAAAGEGADDPISGRAAALMAYCTFGGAFLALGDVDDMARLRIAAYRDFGLHLGMATQERALSALAMAGGLANAQDNPYLAGLKQLTATLCNGRMGA